MDEHELASSEQELLVEDEPSDGPSKDSTEDVEEGGTRKPCCGLGRCHPLVKDV